MACYNHRKTTIIVACLFLALGCIAYVLFHQWLLLRRGIVLFALTFAGVYKGLTKQSETYLQQKSVQYRIN